MLKATNSIMMVLLSSRCVEESKLFVYFLQYVMWSQYQVVSTRGWQSVKLHTVDFFDTGMVASKQSRWQYTRL